MSRGYFSNGISIDADPMIAVGVGKVRGVSHHILQAFYEDVPVADSDFIRWATSYTYPSDTGEAMALVSTEPTDTQSILVIGLDENFLPKKETVNLTGTTLVPLPGLWTRVNNISNVDSTPFTGTVNVTNAGNTVIYCQALPDLQVSDMGIYSSPANKLVQVLSTIGAMVKDGGANSSVGLRVYYRVKDGVFKRAFGF